MKAEEYLDSLTGQIRCRPARDAVREEIRAHIEDQQEAYEMQGLGAEEAEVLAVREMGDPVEAGIELDRIHRPKMAWNMIILTGFLSIVWVILPKLLTVGNAYEGAQEILPRCIFAVVCTGLMIAVCHLDYSRIGCYAKMLAVGLFAALFLGLMLFGAQYNGALCWILVGGTAIDVRVLLLLYAPLYAAILYSYRGGGYKEIAKSILWMAPPFASLLWMPSLLTVALLFCCCFVVFNVAVMKEWYQVSVKKVLCGFYCAVFMAAAAFGGYILLRGPSYQAARLLALLGLQEGESSYCMWNAKAVLAGSRWFGMADSQYAELILNQTGSSLPEGNYMLTELAGYYGSAAAVVLVGLIMFLLLYLLRSCLRQKNQLGMIMGIACAAVLLEEVVLYSMGNAGMIEVVCLCPFVTYGYAGMLLTYVLLGILLSVYRYQSVLSDTAAKPQKGCLVSGFELSDM